MVNPAQATLPLLPQPWSRCHVRPAPDPTRWFTDLINSQKALLTATAGGAEIPGATQSTNALTSFAKWQMDSWNQLTAQWAAMFGMGLPAEPIKDHRFSGEAWTTDPRFEAVARAYLAQVDLLTKALEASPLDERSKGQWSFALRQVTDALSPANNLMTNPRPNSWRWRRWREPDRGPQAVHRGPRQGPHLDDRRVGLRGGR